MNCIIKQLRRLVDIYQGVCHNLQHLTDDRYINGCVAVMTGIIGDLQEIITEAQNGDND